MKRFIKKILIFAALLLITVALKAFQVNVIGQQNGDNYLAAVHDKLERLHSLKSPKIILVGNSNLVFGMDSEMLETAMGMPVVNLGLHGALGNSFHERMAIGGINKGDLVIIAHHTYNKDDKIESPYVCWETIDNDPSVFGILRAGDVADILGAYPAYTMDNFYIWLKGSGNRPQEKPYSRSSYNEYGDILIRPEEAALSEEELFAGTHHHAPSAGADTAARINSFNKYVKDCGATLLIAGAPIAYGKYSEFGVEEIEKLNTDLRSMMDCAVISDFKDYMYPYSYFYDTRYHLSLDGARKRTGQLIEDLKLWQAQNRLIEDLNLSQAQN